MPPQCREPGLALRRGRRIRSHSERCYRHVPGPTAARREQPGSVYMETWRTAIVDSRDGHIRIRGYDVAELMTRATLADMVFLLHQSRLPNHAARALLEAILIAVADHGSGAPSCAAARVAASGNRQSLSAAVAAGILAVGDDHGGAGSGCMELIAANVARARAEGISLAEAADRTVADARSQGRRLPGFGHRVHTTDPRTGIVFR